MSRDHRKLEIFTKADALVLRVYHITQGLPAEERYGLQSQIRRGAVSVATNIVGGCARPTLADDCRFLQISYGSAREVGYLIDLCRRLGFLTSEDSADLVAQYDALCASIFKTTAGLQQLE